ncbi:hypothetical protein chiPu_0000184, partial [Chiloscyllium punctatum]|nr:hypothetical protein [Chiloscyllium punctatum]
GCGAGACAPLCLGRGFLGRSEKESENMLVGMRQMFVLLFVLFMVPVGSQVTLGPTMRDCSDFTNTSCEECLENVSCLWCFVDQRCMKYPVETIIPSNSICPLNEARWGVCWVNFECLIIAMSVVGGLILLPLVCCCCYCCCKKNVCRCCKRKSLSYDEEEEILAKLQEERKQYRKKRDADKKARYDEICKKYGLLQNSDHLYSKFENE